MSEEIEVTRQITAPFPTSEQLMRIHEACTRFEVQFHSENPLRIEELLQEFSVEDRALAIESLIRSDLEMRGVSPDAHVEREYLDRFPQETAAVRKVFAIEQVEVGASVSTLRLKTEGTDPAGGSITSVFASDTFGPYVILGLLGRGGMGVVYRARHIDLGREVALKLLLDGGHADENSMARFRREAAAIGRLQHPGIVPVFDYGQVDGHFYFTMPIIEGQSLADSIREHPLPARQVAVIARDLAFALQYAHEQGLVHRDVKPRNVLMNIKGDVFLTDFGLAKAVGADSESLSELTHAGEVLGTPSYMAPEQAKGTATAQSDIYSLGAVMYTLLTGKPPFQAPSPVETLRQVLDAEVVEPRRILQQIPKDMDTIVIKCLCKQTEGRYASAAALADDLTRFLDGRPIMARRISPLEITVRWIKRNPAVAAMLAGLFFSLATATVVSTAFYFDAVKKSRQADKNFEIALSTVQQFLMETSENVDLRAVGLEETRAEFLKMAQKFYRQMEEQPNQTLQAKRAILEAHNRLGSILQDIGELEEARDQFIRMREEASKLLEHDENDTGFKHSLAVSMQNEASVCQELNQWDSVESLLLKARELFSTNMQVTNSFNSALALASVDGDLVLYYGAKGRDHDEIQILKEINELLEVCIAEENLEQLNEPSARTLLKIVTNVGTRLHARGESEQAVAWFQQASSAGEQVIARLASKDPLLLQNYAMCVAGLATVLVNLQRFDEAREPHEIADQIYERLVSEHPLVVTYLESLATHRMNLGGMEYGRGRWVESNEVNRQSLSLWEMLVKRQPTNAEYQLALAQVGSNLGNSLYQLGHYDEAETTFADAIKNLDNAAQHIPDDVNIRYFTAVIKNNLANVYNGQKKYTEAAAAYEQAAMEGKQLMSDHPSIAVFPPLVAISLHNAATSYRRMEDSAQAEQLEIECKELLETQLQLRPDAVDLRSHLVSCLNELGNVYFDQSRLEEANQVYGESLQSLGSLLESDDGERFHTMVGYVCFNLARIAREREDDQAAVEWSSKAISAQKTEFRLRDQADENDTRRVREALTNACHELARGLYRLGRFDDALATCVEGLTYETGDQADGLRAHYARVLVGLGQAQSAATLIGALSSDAEMNFLDYLDAAHVYLDLVDAHAELIDRDEAFAKAAGYMLAAEAKRPQKVSARIEDEISTLHQRLQTP